MKGRAGCFKVTSWIALAIALLGIRTQAHYELHQRFYPPFVALLAAATLTIVCQFRDDTGVAAQILGPVTAFGAVVVFLLMAAQGVMSS